MNENLRVALLIDTDNVSDVHADELFKRVAVYGNIVVRKGYGVLRTDGFKWRKQVIFRHAIEPVARYVYLSGKNVTDFALVIDALDLAYREIVDMICIVSDDSDFSLLAMKLREIGVKVCGFGTHRASQPFISACDQFVRLGPKQDELQTSITENSTDSSQVLEEKDVDKEQSDLKESTQENFADSTQTLEEKDIRKMLGEAYDNCHDYDGWVLLSEVGGYLTRINPEFSAKNYGEYKTLTELVNSLEEYEIHNDPVRLETKIKKKT